MEPTQMRDPIPDQLPPVIEAISDFIFVRDEPAPADLIFLPGSSHDEHVRKAAELCLAGYAPLILPSGLHGKLTGRFSGDPSYPSEFAFMRDLLISLGIRDEQILKEDRATFTWENALFSRQVTDRRGLRVDRAILCCRACHARRALFYYQSAFPVPDRGRAASGPGRSPPHGFSDCGYPRRPGGASRAAVPI